MDTETRTFISSEMNKLVSSMTRGFQAVEHRLDNVELRLGSLETKVDNLSDMLEQEMVFTSDFRDEFAGRLKSLEARTIS